MSERKAVVVYGAGGHGKVVADALLASGERVLGFLDDSAAPTREGPLGLPVLGTGEWLAANRGAKVALGVGHNSAREAVARRCAGWGVELATVVHPASAVASSAVLEPGVVILANAVVNADAHVGMGAIVNSGAVVEHDCVVGPFSHVSPNAALGGGVTLGAGVHVGICSSVLPGVRVGSGTVVGGGAVVTRDLPSDAVATGVPARTRGT